MQKPIRVLLAKPGSDGHDRAIRLIGRALRDAGMEVIYLKFVSPEQIAETAVQEDVVCVGLSSLSGAHPTHFPAVVKGLRQRGADDIVVIGGGIIPKQDIPELKAAGIHAVFGPGTPLKEIVRCFEECGARQAAAGGN